MKEILKNNSNDMKTIVETYLIEETIDLIYDNDKLDKWNDKIKELGLVGQSQIIKKDKSPIPFLHMKESVVAIFKTLCPVSVEIKDFNIQPIPLEILDLVSLSIKERYFDIIQVWYDEKLDPAVIGIKTNYRIGFWGNEGLYELKGKEFESKEQAVTVCKNTYPNFNVDRLNGENSNKYYLIGKWGDVKQSIDELKEKAKIRYKESRLMDYKKTISCYNNYINDIDIEVNNKFS